MKVDIVLIKETEPDFNFSKFLSLGPFFLKPNSVGS